MPGSRSVPARDNTTTSAEDASTAQPVIVLSPAKGPAEREAHPHHYITKAGQLQSRARTTTVSQSAEGNMELGFKYGVYWLDDSDATYCPLCEDEFGVFTRKHHCRSGMLKLMLA